MKTSTLRRKQVDSSALRRTIAKATTSLEGSRRPSEHRRKNHKVPGKSTGITHSEEKGKRDGTEGWAWLRG